MNNNYLIQEWEENSDGDVVSFLENYYSTLSRALKWWDDNPVPASRERTLLINESTSTGWVCYRHTVPLVSPDSSEQNDLKNEFGDDSSSSLEQGIGESSSSSASSIEYSSFSSSSISSSLEFSSFTSSSSGSSISNTSLSSSSLSSSSLSSSSLSSSSLSSSSLSSSSLSSSSLSSSSLSSSSLSSSSLSSSSLSSSSGVGETSSSTFASISSSSSQTITSSSSSSTSSLEFSSYTSSSSSTVNVIEVNWHNFINCNVATGDPNTLEKFSSDNAWDGGATSMQMLLSGAGFVDWEIESLSTRKYVGLNDQNDPQDSGRDSCKWGILSRNGNFIVRESGFNVFSSNNVLSVGDRLRIRISQLGVVTYWHNTTLMYTSNVRMVYPISVDASIREIGARVVDAILHGNWV